MPIRILADSDVLSRRLLVLHETVTSPARQVTRSARIVVVGSSNTDMVVRVSKLPRPGETVIGGDFFTARGGKGANQAVAAARAGGFVALIACLGNDAIGDETLAALAAEGLAVAPRRPRAGPRAGGR